MTFKIIPREISHALSGKELIGKRVCRGPDWNWNSGQDNDGRSAGEVIASFDMQDCNVHVKWDFNGTVNGYDFRSGKHDLDIIDESKPIGRQKIIDRGISHRLKPEDIVGKRVVRGPDWAWGDQDSGGPGTVTEVCDRTDFGAQTKNRKILGVRVQWDSRPGRYLTYRWDLANDAFDLDLVDDSPDQPADQLVGLEPEPERLDLSKFPKEVQDKLKDTPDYIHSMVRKHYGV